MTYTIYAECSLSLPILLVSLLTAIYTKECKSLFAHMSWDTFFLHADIAKEKCLQEFEIFDMKDRTEYEANTFAAHLLIDDEELIDLLKSGRDCFSVAMILTVNPNLLNIKLSDMNRMGYSFPTSWGSSRLF